MLPDLFDGVVSSPVEGGVTVAYDVVLGTLDYPDRSPAGQALWLFLKRNRPEVAPFQLQFNLELLRGRVMVIQREQAAHYLAGVSRRSLGLACCLALELAEFRQSFGTDPYWPEHLGWLEALLLFQPFVSSEQNECDLETLCAQLPEILARYEQTPHRDRLLDAVVALTQLVALSPEIPAALSAGACMQAVRDITEGGRSGATRWEDISRPTTFGPLQEAPPGTGRSVELDEG